MRKLRLIAAATAALVLPSLLGAGIGFAADAASPDTEAMIKAVQASGLTCDLGPATVQERKADHWLVEFRCASQDDGRIGVFPTTTGGTTMVYDCLTAHIAGYVCGKTKENVAYPAMNTTIRNVDRNLDCRVTKTQMLGTSRDKKNAYLEVKCDNTRMNNQLVQFDTTNLKAVAVIDCSEATQMTAGGCRMPGAVVNAKDPPSNSLLSQDPLGAAASGITGVTRNLGGVGPASQ